MDNFSTKVAVAGVGAARSAARPPWTTVAGTGASHALGQSRLLAAGQVDARRAASWSGIQVRQIQAPQTPSVALMAAELTPSTETLRVNVTRKPNFVHKTRINAGGYGAMGPHPERERLA